MKTSALLELAYKSIYKYCFILCLLFVSCGTNSNDGTKTYSSAFNTNRVQYPLVLKTKYGDVLVKEKPKRIVSLTLTSDEILHELLDGNVFALSYISTNKAFSKIYDKINTNTKIVRGDSEVVLSLKPDFLIMASFVSADIRDTLKNNVETVYTIDDIYKVDHIKNTIYDIGSIVDRREKAVQIIDRIDNAVLSVSNEVAKNNYHPEILLLTVNGYTAGKNTSFDEVANLSGAVNISSKLNIIGHTEIPLEILLKTKIDYIVSSEYNITEEEIIKYFKNHNVYKNIEAVKNDRIIVIPHEVLVSTSQYFIGALDMLYSKLSEARKKELEKDLSKTNSISE